MAADRSRAKTENLSLRLDPKTKFMLDFMARLRSQSITSVVEQSIRDAVGNTGVGEYYDNGRTEFKYRWSDFWDPSEGIRTLKLLSIADYPTTFDEDELRQFTLDHWCFFYSSKNYQTPLRAYVDILWPNIAEYLSIWKKTRGTHYWAAGKAMCEALEATSVKPPAWPPRDFVKPKSITDDLDDDIPF